jgi:hypothetical protein
MVDEKNVPVDAFLKLVDERFAEFKQKLDEFMVAFVTNPNGPEKIAKAMTAFQAGNALKLAIARPYWPAWIEPITASLETYTRGNGQIFADVLIKQIGLAYGAITNHVWAFGVPEDKGFDFDGVFQKYKAESRLPELFDKLAGLLEELVKCDDLDSRKIIHTLQTIIETLKKSKNGSYFSMMAAWNYGGTFLKKFAWNALSEIPALRVVVKSVRETMEEINKDMEKLHKGMQDELQGKLNAEFPVLTYADLPLPPQPAITDDSVIDVEARPVIPPENK